MMNRKTAVASSVFLNLFLRETKLHSRGHALIERVNTRRVHSARVRRAYLHDFSALAFYFSRPGPSGPPAWRLRPLPPHFRVCKPVSCLAHSLTTNFVNGFHSGGFSRSSRAISGASTVPFFSSLFLCLFAALSHRAPLQLPLSSANRFKSSGSHRHAHKTRQRKEDERRGAGPGGGGGGPGTRKREA